MFQVADWSRRKLEIADAFRQAAPLPAEADHEFYAELLIKIGVSTNQDMNIFISFITTSSWQPGGRRGPPRR